MFPEKIASLEELPEEVRGAAKFLYKQVGDEFVFDPEAKSLRESLMNAKGEREKAREGMTAAEKRAEDAEEARKAAEAKLAEFESQKTADDVGMDKEKMEEIIASSVAKAREEDQARITALETQNKELTAGQNETMQKFRSTRTKNKLRKALDGLDYPVKGALVDLVIEQGVKEWTGVADDGYSAIWMDGEEAVRNAEGKHSSYDDWAAKMLDNLPDAFDLPEGSDSKPAGDRSPGRTAHASLTEAAEQSPAEYRAARAKTSLAPAQAS